MKICLLGEYSENLDEGMRKISVHLSKELSKRHSVLTLDLRDVAAKNFWKSIKSFNPQIVHYIHGGSSRGFILLKLISLYCSGAKTVTSIMRFPTFSKYTVSFFKPDLILVQSYEVEKDFKREGCKTKFLPCGGVDIARFTPITSVVRSKMREKYRIEKEKFVILHIGSIKYGRNVQLLEELQNDDNQVLIAGSTSTGIDWKVYQRLVDAGCLVWTKYIENIEEIYALSDCYVFPVVLKKDNMGRAVADSIEMPLSVLEAMSCNLPVITTKFGALPRVFEEGDGLFFAEKEDDFLTALDKIKNGVIKVKTREKVLPYSWGNIGKKMEEIYLGLVGGENK